MGFKICPARYDVPDGLLTDEFCFALRKLVTDHHGVYPRLPPRDIFFEDLVARAFRNTGQTDISLSTPGRSKEDMTVDGVRLSIKTETGYGTDLELITITKLSTTENTPWESAPLIARILSHLAEYERMLMLRAIWLDPPGFHYQLLEVPICAFVSNRDAYRLKTGGNQKRQAEQELDGFASGRWGNTVSGEL